MHTRPPVDRSFPGERTRATEEEHSMSAYNGRVAGRPGDHFSLKPVSLVAGRTVEQLRTWTKYAMAPIKW
jgi:hypothetical protein